MRTSRILTIWTNYWRVFCLRRKFKFKISICCFHNSTHDGQKSSDFLSKNNFRLSLSNKLMNGFATRFRFLLKIRRSTNGLSNIWKSSSWREYFICVSIIEHLHLLWLKRSSKGCCQLLRKSCPSSMKRRNSYWLTFPSRMKSKRFSTKSCCNKIRAKRWNSSNLVQIQW